jgi:hypothetical protein
VGRTLERQVVASTHEDRHGERLQRAELEELLAGMPGQRLINLDHDPRRPPVARAYNNRLEHLDDGDWAITSDIEVLDEDAFQHVRGVSIAFTRRLVSRTATEPALLISYNPRYVERERLSKALGAFERLEGEAALVERSEKSLTGLVLIWLIVSHGFWEEAGADLYRFAKSLLTAALSPEKETEVAIEIKTDVGDPELLLLVKKEGSSDAHVDPAALIAEAAELAPGNEIVKVVAELDGAGKATIGYAVDAAGTTLRPGP